MQYYVTLPCLITMQIGLFSECQKQYRGLCAQDLQEAKDQMLVETADMLRVSLMFT